MNFDYAAYFVRRVGLCGGALVVKGTRVQVRTLLASLAEGATELEVLADFATVPRDGLRAVIAFAAAAVRDDLPLRLRNRTSRAASEFRAEADLAVGRAALRLEALVSAMEIELTVRQVAAFHFHGHAGHRFP